MNSPAIFGIRNESEFVTMAYKGKRSKEIGCTCKQGKVYGLSDAVLLLKQTAKAKFDETVDIAIILGLIQNMLIRWCVV